MFSGILRKEEELCDMCLEKRVSSGKFQSP